MNFAVSLLMSLLIAGTAGVVAVFIGRLVNARYPLPDLPPLDAPDVDEPTGRILRASVTVLDPSEVGLLFADRPAMARWSR